MGLPEGAPERRVLEQRYGIANIRRLVAKHLEDEANKKWMDESTMACPSCNIKVEKSAGCNHVRHSVLEILRPLVLLSRRAAASRLCAVLELGGRGAALYLNVFS